MDETATKNVIEAALLAAGRPVTFDKLVELFSSKGVDVDRGELRSAIKALGDEYADRGIELKEVASGYRIQVRSNTRDWLDPLFEERAPRYTRALLETLALVAYRQPITRAEIEDIRGVSVSSNIVRTLIERGWVRVVGYRDVPGKPSMLGTTKDFLDYFGLKRLEDLPPLSEIKDFSPTTNPQSDLVDVLEDGLSRALEHETVARIGDGHEATTASVAPSETTEGSGAAGSEVAEGAVEATTDEPGATRAGRVRDEAGLDRGPKAELGSGDARPTEPGQGTGDERVAEDEPVSESRPAAGQASIESQPGTVEAVPAGSDHEEAEAARKVVRLRQPEPEQAG